MLACPYGDIIYENTYLRTNLIGGQPSTSDLCINFRTKISYTTHMFRTKKTHSGPGPGR